MSGPKIETVSGGAYAALGNDVSAALHRGITGGLEVDEACSVALGVVADYWRRAYPLNEEAIAGMSAIIRAKAMEGMQ